MLATEMGVNGFAAGPARQKHVGRAWRVCAAFLGCPALCLATGRSVRPRRGLL